jgi:hypothetical protein
MRPSRHEVDVPCGISLARQPVGESAAEVASDAPDSEDASMQTSVGTGSQRNPFQPEFFGRVEGACAPLANRARPLRDGTEPS